MSVVDASTFTVPIAAEPGQIHVEGHRLFVACAQKTWLELVEVQLEGKKRLAASEFLRGAVLAEGARLGAATP
jgi:methionyl-tRNA formyltransferase